MATPPMAAAVRNCVPGENAAHDGGNGRIAGPKEQMKVVPLDLSLRVHYDPYIGCQPDYLISGKEAFSC